MQNNKRLLEYIKIIIIACFIVLNLLFVSHVIVNSVFMKYSAVIQTLIAIIFVISNKLTDHTHYLACNIWQMHFFFNLQNKKCKKDWYMSNLTDILTWSEAYHMKTKSCTMREMSYILWMSGCVYSSQPWHLSVDVL